MAYYIEPVVLETKKGHAILHESGVYFLDKNDDVAKCIAEISKKRRPELPIEREKREKLAKVVIYLSSNCNLRCIYCYASAGDKNSVVSVENAKILIDYVAQKADRIILDFHGGGEPLLYFDIIRHLVEYAKATGKLYRTVLISNGVIIGNKTEILQWIVDNVDVMALSCDGYPELQNKNRPRADGKDSSTEIEETIRFFQEHNYVYTVRSTITKEGAAKLYEITKYFAELGVKYLVYSPCYNFGRSDDSNLVPDPQVYSENYMKAVKFAYEHGIRLTSNSFRFPGYHYCGALSGFNIALTTDNYISSCYEVVSSEDKTAEAFIVGQIKGGKIDLFKDKIASLKNMENTDSQCEKCDYQLVCRGGCPVKKVRNSNESLGNLCAITKILVPKMLDFLHENPNAASSVLKNVDLEYNITN